MVLSVRLDPATARALARLARRTGRSRSAVVRDAIRRLSEGAADEPATETVYDRLAPLLGVVNLGPGDRAARSEEILRAMFAAKRPGR